MLKIQFARNDPRLSRQLSVVCMSGCNVRAVRLQRLNSPTVAPVQSGCNAFASVDPEFGIERYIFRDRTIHFSESNDSKYKDY